MGPHPTEDEWQRAVVAYLKAAMREQEIDFGQLSKLLAEAGVDLERVPLANKINRGTFSAGFLLQVLSILDIEQTTLDDIASLAPREDQG